MWVLVIQTQSSCLHGKHSYFLSHALSPALASFNPVKWKLLPPSLCMQEDRSRRVAQPAQGPISVETVKFRPGVGIQFMCLEPPRLYNLHSFSCVGLNLGPQTWWQVLYYRATAPHSVISNCWCFCLFLFGFCYFWVPWLPGTCNDSCISVSWVLGLRLQMCVNMPGNYIFWGKETHFPDIPGA